MHSLSDGWRAGFGTFFGAKNKLSLARFCKAGRSMCSIPHIPSGANGPTFLPFAPIRLSSATRQAYSTPRLARVGRSVLPSHRDLTIVSASQRFAGVVKGLSTEPWPFSLSRNEIDDRQFQLGAHHVDIAINPEWVICKFAILIL